MFKYNVMLIGIEIFLMCFFMENLSKFFGFEDL